MSVLPTLLLSILALFFLALVCACFVYLYKLLQSAHNVFERQYSDVDNRIKALNARVENDHIKGASITEHRIKLE